MFLAVPMLNRDVEFGNYACRAAVQKRLIVSRTLSSGAGSRIGAVEPAGDIQNL